MRNNLVYRLHIDTPLLAGVIIMCLLGLVVLYSASEQSIDLVAKQGLRMFVGLVVMLFIAQIPPQRLAHWAPLVYLGALILLGLVLLFGTGRGVQRWLDAGIFRFQPSELMKVVVPLTVASLVAKKLLPPDLKTILLSIVVIAIPTFLIGRQPDLGTAIVVAASGLVVLFFSGISWKFIRNSLFFGIAIAPIGWFAMHEYQRQRVLTLFNPDNDALGAGYHIIQSIIAVGSGGIFGKGWLNGTQSHLEFLPERATDFIFAVYCEEFGLVGVVVMLLGYSLIIARGVQIAFYAQDTFGRLLAIVLTLMLFLSVFINMSMVTGQLPVVGIPLPLISYGGTSVVTVMICMGVLMSIQTHRRLVF